MTLLSRCLLSAVLAGAACGHGSSDAAAPQNADAPAAACPAAVKQSIAAKFPDASTSACKLERVEGRDQFEVKLTQKGGEKVEVDVAPDGTILQIEEPIALDGVPAAVMSAFATRYPSAKPTAAEKQTRTGKIAAYELAFTLAGKSKEATFAADGTFLGEE